MTHFVKNNRQGSPQSALEQQISAEVELGIAAAADPINANRPDQASRETTLYSPWFARTCRVCKDKFRIGDQVRLCPRCSEPYHDDDQYNLRCWQKQFAHGAICNEGGIDRFSEQGIPRCEFSWAESLSSSIAAPENSSQDFSLPSGHDPLLVKQFISGVEMTWKPFGELQSYKILPDSPYIGRRCPWCRFRVRAGDWVVACPCSGNCGTFFHQDVFHRLTCWNEWNGRMGNNYCPNTGKPYPESLEGIAHDF